jgi:hypothetical protein
MAETIPQRESAMSMSRIQRRLRELVQGALPLSTQDVPGEKLEEVADEDIKLRQDRQERGA